MIVLQIDVDGVAIHPPERDPPVSAGAPVNQAVRTAPLPHPCRRLRHRRQQLNERPLDRRLARGRDDLLAEEVGDVEHVDHALAEGRNVRGGDDEIKLGERSRHFQRRYRLDLFTERLLGAMKIVSLLEIEPEIGTVSTQLPQPQSHARSHRLPFLKNVVKRLTRHAEQLGDLSLRTIERRQNIHAQKLAGMHGWQAALRGLLGHGGCPQ